MTSTFNTTPTGERLHIGVFGRRNVGKSTFINYLTDQELSLVSEVPGTTTDPVYKSMEVLPLGPVMFMDTAGIDDEGALGVKRIAKTKEVLRKTELALMVVNNLYLDKVEKELITSFKERSIPYLLFYNDIARDEPQKEQVARAYEISSRLIKIIDCRNEDKRNSVLDFIATYWRQNQQIDLPDQLIGDLIEDEDLVLLIIPLDSGAPKDRLILPQMQTLRRILDHGGQVIISEPNSIISTLNKLNQLPALAVTDSQVFARVDQSLPAEIPLTGFSILFARYKGDLRSYLAGIKYLEKIKPGMNILIAETCSHRRGHEDIGTVKIPAWLETEAGGSINFKHYAGRDFPSDIADYDLAILCGGCMANRQEIMSRINIAIDSNTPVVNYGMLIAWKMGILTRALQPFFPGVNVYNEIL
ncbi:MAG: [FeFe] hydrogenase H-cluster maturation GTPase HydF [Bacillota bacterium]